MRAGATLLFAAGLAACAAAPKPGLPAQLAGTRWVGLVEGIADPRMLPRLEFVNASRLVGYTGCNAMSGSWHMEGGELHLALASTKRACLGPAGEIEQRLIAALSGRAHPEGDRLVFVAPDGSRFAFAPAAAS